MANERQAHLRDDPSRRSVLRGAVGVSSAASLGVSKAIAAGSANEASMLQFLAVVSELVIPSTATSGAGDPANAKFIAAAFASGYNDYNIKAPSVVRAALNARAGGDFLTLTPARQAGVLKDFDAESYRRLNAAPTRPAPKPDLASALHSSKVAAPPQPDVSPQQAWHDLKKTILAAYYTSEVGASKELNYDLAPGKFLPDISLTPSDRAMSNDWFAVSFR